MFVTLYDVKLKGFVMLYVVFADKGMNPVKRIIPSYYFSLICILAKGHTSASILFMSRCVNIPQQQTDNLITKETEKTRISEDRQIPMLLKSKVIRFQLNLEAH